MIVATVNKYEIYNYVTEKLIKILSFIVYK